MDRVEGAHPALSVRARMLGATVAIAAVGMALAGSATYLVQREQHLRQLDERLLANVEAARSLLSGSGTASAQLPPPSVPEREPVAVSSSSDAVRAVLGGVIPTRFQSAVGILDGSPVYVPGVPTSFRLDSEPTLIDRFVEETEGDTVALGTAATGERVIRYIAIPIGVTGDDAQGIYATAFDVDAELAELAAAFRTYSVIAAATLVAIAVVGWFVAGRALAPIRSLRNAAQRISASDLGVRIPVVGQDDVSDLTRTVNAMFDRLESAVSGQRRLLSDVRHELATPITIVRGHLETLDPDDAAEVIATRSLLLDELDRMGGLVDDIDVLADSDGAFIHLAPTDVGDLTRAVFAKVSAVRGHAWRLAEAAETVAAVDAARITQAWIQLADNAAKFSAMGTPIAIGSVARADAVEFWVADRGPGVPPESRARIFERLGRADGGRGIRGSGLGLPIVAAIAAAHGGEVTLRSSPTGSRFGISVPLGGRRAPA